MLNTKQAFCGEGLQSLLKQFRISELDVNENDDRITEFQFKHQGPLSFFLNFEELHNHCRHVFFWVFLAKWFSLIDMQDDGNHVTEHSL